MLYLYIVLLKPAFKIRNALNQMLINLHMLLYLNYINFYNHTHLKYFNNIKIRADNILKDINNDIIFEKNVLSNEFAISNINL